MTTSFLIPSPQSQFLLPSSFQLTNNNNSSSSIAASSRIMAQLLPKMNGIYAVKNEGCQIGDGSEGKIQKGKGKRRKMMSSREENDKSISSVEGKANEDNEQPMKMLRRSPDQEEENSANLDEYENGQKGAIFIQTAEDANNITAGSTITAQNTSSPVGSIRSNSTKNAVVADDRAASVADFWQPRKYSTPTSPDASSSSMGSSTNGRSPTMSKRLVEKPEICLICGQKAQCLNFGAHCCHACRMFFRRSVLNFREFVCKFDGNCDNRKGKNCRSCRFDACLMAQLDISLIQFPPDYNVTALKRRLEQKRKEIVQRKRNKMATTIVKEENSEEKSFVGILELMEFNKCLDHLLLAEGQATKLRNCPNNLLLEYLCGKSMADLLGSQMNVLNFVELFTMNGAPLKNEEDQMMEAQGVPFIANYLNLDMLLNVELMRTLAFLDDLPMEDRVHLFRHNIHKLVTLSNGFYSCQLNAETVTYPNRFRPINLCRKTMEHSLQNEKLKKYVNLRRRAFCDVMDEFRQMNLSVEEFALLRVIIFCNNVPEQCSSDAKLRLKAEAERFARCLLRHQQMKMGEAAGARKYAECLLFATKLFAFNRRQAKFYQLLDWCVFGISNGPNPSHPPFVFECLLYDDFLTISAA